MKVGTPFTGTLGGTEDLGPLVDPQNARRYKRFLALAGVAQLARACACQARGPPPPDSRSAAVPNRITLSECSPWARRGGAANDGGTPFGTPPGWRHDGARKDPARRLARSLHPRDLCSPGDTRSSELRERRARRGFA